MKCCTPLLRLCLAAAVVFLAAACVPITPPGGTVPPPAGTVPAPEDTAVSAAVEVAAPSSPEKVLLVGSELVAFPEPLAGYLEQLAASATPPLPLQVDDGHQVHATLRSHHDYMAHLAPRMIQNNNYDVVLLQDDIPIYEQSVDPFHAAVRAFTEDIRAVNGEPVLLIAFGRIGEPFDWIDIAGTAEAHRTIAEELGLRVVPWGPAMSQIESDRPELSMRGTCFAVDEVPECASPAAMYLGAAMIYALLYGESPEGLPYYPEEMSAEDAAYFQRVAWEAVQEWNAE